MKKKILLVLLTVCLLCGCEKTIPKLENGEEAIVSFKDGSLISVNELYKKMKNSYATSMLIEMIDKKILEDKYADKMDNADEYVENTIKSVKSYYPDESELLSALKQYGYNSLEEYSETIRLSYLRNLAIEDYIKSTISEDEIKKYYKNEIVGDREISHILIIPDVKDNMTDEEKSNAEEEANTTAKSIIARLKKGEKFEDLASEFSSDEATKENGGSLGRTSKGSYGSDEFDKEAFSLDVGAYSNVPIKTTDGYEIIYITKEYEKKDLEEVRESIIKELTEEKKSTNSTVQVDGLKALRNEYGMDIVDDEIASSYNKYMNSLYNQTSQS